MKLTIQAAADFVRAKRPPRQFAQLLASASEIIDFEAERLNRPPRFVEIVNCYRGGQRIADIVAKYNCSRGTVLRYARLAGLPKRPKHFDRSVRDETLKLYRAGRPIAEIAARLSVSQAYVSKLATEHGINRRKFS